MLSDIYPEKGRMLVIRDNRVKSARASEGHRQSAEASSASSVKNVQMPFSLFKWLTGRDFLPKKKKKKKKRERKEKASGTHSFNFTPAVLIRLKR